MSTGNECEQPFCEEIEEGESLQVPTEEAPARQLEEGVRVITAAHLQENELLRAVMDVALQRIRANNS